MLRRTVLGSLTLSFLVALGAEALAQGKGGGGGTTPPPDPAIVFVENSSKNVLLRVMNADGTNVRTVVTGGKADSIYSPRWSPDGDQLAFAASLGGAQGLWLVDLGGTGLHRIVTFSSGGVQDVDWSPVATPDGSEKIVFTPYNAQTGLNDVWLVNPDGSGLQWLASGLDINSLGGICWNWNATALAASDTCDVTMMYLAPAAGGGLVVSWDTLIVFPNGACATYPRGANTADRIVYDPCCVTSGLGILDLGVSPPTMTLVPCAGGRSPSFSPDDTRLAYERNFGIYTCAADGSSDKLIRYVGNSNCRYPSWRRN